MEKFVWTSDLSVGNDSLDDQHKGLIDIINELQEEGHTDDGIAGILQKLLEYAAQHFRDEENFIIENAPAIIETHFRFHSGFIEKLHEMIDDAAVHPPEQLRDSIYQYLCGWLRDHIMRQDKQYGTGSAIPPG